jgi:hypothetical protein
MLIDWLAVETLAYFETIVPVQHSVPHDPLLFYGVNGQFVVHLVRVTAGTDEVVRTGHSPYDNPRTPQATEPTQETQRPQYRYNPLTMSGSLAQDIIVAFRMPHNMSAVAARKVLAPTAQGYEERVEIDWGRGAYEPYYSMPLQRK